MGWLTGWNRRGATTLPAKNEDEAMAATQPGAPSAPLKPATPAAPKKELTAEEKVQAAVNATSTKPTPTPPPKPAASVDHAALAVSGVQKLKADLAEAQNALTAANAATNAAEGRATDAEERAAAAEAKAADFQQRFQSLCDELGIDTSDPA